MSGQLVDFENSVRGVRGKGQSVEMDHIDHRRCLPSTYIPPYILETNAGLFVDTASIAALES